MQDLNCDMVPDWLRLEIELAQVNLDWLLSQLEEDSRIFFESLETMLAGLDLEFLLSIVAEIANCPLTFAEDEKPNLRKSQTLNRKKP